MCYSVVYCKNSPIAMAVKMWFSESFLPANQHIHFLINYLRRKMNKVRLYRMPYKIINFLYIMVLIS